jgi:putative YphP/YqiW family bacilliredoxin
MPYPEIMIRPMREDLTRLGVEELRTAEAVDETVKNSQGTLMVVVNSICGCAAGKARPGVALALQHEVKPDKVATVFACHPVNHDLGRPPAGPETVRGNKTACVAVLSLV